MPALLLTVFVDLVGFGIVLPLQPFYAQHFGASPATVTLVAASYTAAQFVCAPLWGRLSDRIGRKPVLLATALGSAAGYLGLAFTDSLAGLFLARGFGGAMAGNIGVAHAYVSDVTDAARRARGIGRVSGTAGLGFVAGPAIGGLLAGPDPADPNFRLPFLAAAAAAALAFALACALLRESTGADARRSARARTQPGGRRRSWRRAAEPGIAALLGLIVATPLVFAGIETVFALWAQAALGWGPERTGYMYAFMGGVAVVVQWAAVGPIVGRIGERFAVVLGMAAVLAGCAVLPGAAGMAGVMAGLGAMVFGVALNGTALTSLISQHAAADERGALLGVSQSAAGLGRILGPGLSGAVFAGLGRDWPFHLGALVMLCGAVAALAVARGRRRFLTGTPPGD